MITGHVAEDATDVASGRTSEAVAETVQEAEDEARKIVASARYEAFRLMTGAREEAESILDQARAEAADILTRAGTETPPSAVPSETAVSPRTPPADDAQLREDHSSDPNGPFRGIADQIEERFASMDPTSRGDTGDPQELDPAIPTAREQTRASFYNRRSAKLPRLGEEAGRSALDMSRTMREHLSPE